MDGATLSMLTALIIIVTILVSGSLRLWIRHRFDVTEHLDAVTQAAQRQQRAKQRLHNVQTR